MVMIAIAVAGVNACAACHGGALVGPVQQRIDRQRWSWSTSAFISACGNTDTGHGTGAPRLGAGRGGRAGSKDV